MKKIKFKFLALLLITSVAFLSCKKEDRLSPSSNISNSNDSNTETIIIGPKWKITLFQVNEINQTKFFNKYIFIFAGDRIFKAIENNNLVNGNYSSGKRDGTLIIMFPSVPLSKLNRNWNVIQHTPTLLKLERVNRSGGSDYLHFQRITRPIDYNQHEITPE